MRSDESSVEETLEKRWKFFRLQQKAFDKTAHKPIHLQQKIATSFQRQTEEKKCLSSYRWGQASIVQARNFEWEI